MVQLTGCPALSFYMMKAGYVNPSELLSDMIFGYLSRFNLHTIPDLVLFLKKFLFNNIRLQGKLRPRFFRRSIGISPLDNLCLPQILTKLVGSGWQTSGMVYFVLFDHSIELWQLHLGLHLMRGGLMSAREPLFVVEKSTTLTIRRYHH